MEIKAQCPKNNQCPFSLPCPWPMHCPPCPDYPEIIINKKEMKKYNTIFCDIDGSIFKYRKFETYESSEPEPCRGACEKLKEWADEGHMIILTTARPEYLRDHTVKELQKYGVSYHRLIMEIERGPRFLINDMDPDKPGERATGINLIRNEGFSDVNWDKMGL